ncbi:MAG TPA: Ku protein [Acidimicrobiales bacterium]|nr:Ku protein [Acidimicrobiales bacterium]
MPRPIWSGSISFGLVNVPVKLFTAVRKKSVRFHQLHASDGARIQQRRVCSADGEEVAYEDLVKGYELYPGQYVVIDPDELDALDPEATQTIDIEDFVDLAEIDPLFYDASYYLVPDARGTKAYRLLLDAMRDTGRVGIARVVMRTKQYLCAVRPVGEALVLTTMNFADEVVTEDEMEGLPGEQEATDRELKMAGALIDSLTTEWEPERYTDTYRERVLELIEAKSEGQELVSQPSAGPSAPVVDLMAALEASLKAPRAGREPAPTEAADAAPEEQQEEHQGQEEQQAKTG